MVPKTAETTARVVWTTALFGHNSAMVALSGILQQGVVLEKEVGGSYPPPPLV